MGRIQGMWHRSEHDTSPKRDLLEQRGFYTILCVVAIILGVGTWYYLAHIFVPYERNHQPQPANRCNQSDLYPRWLGTRELLLHGRNPYSPEVTREIQIGYYGQPVEFGHFSADPQAFVYPVYTVFLLAPTMGLPFCLVSALFGVVLTGFTIASVYLWTRALNLRFSGRLKLLAALVILASWPIAEGLYVRQLSLLVAFLLAWAGAEITRGHFKVAGACLACSTIKPQLALPLIAWLLLWASGNWRERKALIGSFLTAMGVLLIAAELILPHWFRGWLDSLPEYLAYTGSKSSLERLFGLLPGKALGCILMAAVASLCWRLRKHSSTSESFAFACCLVLSATLVVLPTWSLASYNQVLLIPAGLWVLSV